MQIHKWTIFLLIFFGGKLLFGVPLKYQNKKQLVNQAGLYEGGGLSEGLHLFALKRLYSKSKSFERWVFQFKTLKKKDFMGEPPKYYLSYEPKKRNVRIYLKRIYSDKLNLSKIDKMVSRSGFIKSYNIIFDPIEVQTIIQWTFKKSVQLRLPPVGFKKNFYFEIEPLNNVVK